MICNVFRQYKIAIIMSPSASYFRDENTMQASEKIVILRLPQCVKYVHGGLGVLRHGNGNSFYHDGAVRSLP